MEKITRIIALNRIIPVGLGLLVWTFFALFYRHHLHYHEQLQLFLTTPGYLCEHLARPGGMAIYLGGFITQFFVDAVWGAFLIALLLVGIQQGVARLARRVADKPAYEWLSCLPSIGYALLLCDENVMLSGGVALLLALVAVGGYTRIRVYGWRIVFALTMILVLYWLIGFAVVVFFLVCLFIEWTGKDRKRYLIHYVGMALFGLLLLMLSPLTAKAVIGGMPLTRFVFAGDYYRFVAFYQLFVPFVQLSVVAVLMLVRYLPSVAARRGWLVQLIQVVLLGALVIWGLYTKPEWEKEDVMGYDYYTREQKWESIITLADRNTPTGPLTVMTLNLALGQTGGLGDYMFSYFQNGPEGLLPSFSKDYMSAVMAGEVYYYLGMVNTAQRFTFEAMETIPDYQKSVRCIKRLAETNLINGRYTVAAKYLSLLEQTQFYREWAKEAMACLGDEARINAHPEWGVLRQYKPKGDFLFSEDEKDQMMGLLFTENPANRMAYDYLMAYTLLAKDLDHFPGYFMMGEHRLVHPVTPKSYQEALAYIWSMHQGAEAPAQVSPAVMQRMNSYRQVYTSLSNPEPLLRKDYGDTYWYYLQFRRN